MSTKPETRRYGRVAAVILGVGLLIFIPLVLLANHMINEANLRARIAANESAAIDTIDLIAAAEQIHLDSYGEYGTLRRLTDAGILHINFNGEPPVFKGYVFTLKLTPRTGTQAAAFSLNADPLRRESGSAGDATGRRHFYRGSDVTGIRFNEERPAEAGDTALPRVIGF